MHFDILSFWADRQKTFPILSKIVRIVHCIPASSAEIERTWSAAGLILTSQRSRMNVKNFKHTLFCSILFRIIKIDWKLLDNVGGIDLIDNVLFIYFSLKIIVSICLNFTLKAEQTILP